MKEKFLNFSLFLLFALVIALTPNVNYAADKNDIVKALTIYKISKYVDISGRESGFKVCHNSSPLFHKALDEFDKSDIITVHKLSEVDPNSCDIVYLSKNNTSQIPTYINRYRNKPVATVSDTLDFVSQYRGLVEIFDNEGKFELIIDVKRAGDLGVEFNSKIVESAILTY